MIPAIAQGRREREVLALLQRTARPLTVREATRLARLPVTTVYRAFNRFAEDVAFPGATGAFWLRGRERPGKGLVLCRACGTYDWSLREKGPPAWYVVDECERC